jgi:AraC-like DNA-binding protein
MGQPRVDRPGRGVYPAGARLAPRTLDDWELVWLVRGRATLTGTPVVALRPGHVLLIPPAHPHGFDWNPHGLTEHGYVHFDLAAVPGAPTVGTHGDGGTGPVHAVTGRGEPLAALCAYLERPAVGDRHAVAVVVRQVLEHLLVLPAPGEPAAERLPPAVDRAVRHLRGAWATAPAARVPVGELAAAAAVSPVHLNRLVRTAFGLSVAAGVERLRCLRAATLLERTDLTTAEIARQCGFADASHFSHRFREVTGRTPRAVRDGDPPGPLRDDPGLRLLDAVVQAL